ncbi:unnamed protein product [Arabis nemorensis]|uniref:UBX domain-containing protein n=1 Tax=Arabis nemorensis TaxID=586526 RepID=A0A565BDC1_9BRAS|nr:unnamed protein product [Arabis nemorensis]
MADDNSPTTEEARENLISSFTHFTSLSRRLVNVISLTEPKCLVRLQQREEARSFLQSHHWNLDDAVSAFVQNNVAVESNIFISSDQQNPGILNARAPSSWNLGIDYDPSTSLIRSRSPSPPSRARYPNLSTGQPAGDIRTSGDTSGGTAKDSDEPMENYVGGDQSGTMVQDTQQGREDDDANDILTLSLTLRRNGCTVNDGPTFKTFDPKDEDFIKYLKTLKSPCELRIRFNLIRRQDEDYHVPPFQGVGRTLGSDSVSSEPPASSPPSLATSTGQPAGDIRVSSDSYEPQENYGRGDQSGTMEQDHQESEERPQVITPDLTLWRNGFSIHDMPLMTLDRPENVNFIQESPMPFTSFQGIGINLGSGSVSAEPSVSLVVDPAAPTTSIQLRLADGTSIVSRFNTHHTVRDIRGFIDESRPDGSRDYQLLSMGVPPRPLTNLDQTIEDADISNSVLIQKY